MNAFRNFEIAVAGGWSRAYIPYIPKQGALAPRQMNHFRNSETVHELKDLGRLVRAQRRASGLRIDDAAALCGVSVDLLSRLENGRSGVSSERLLKVLDSLGLVMMIVEKSKAAKLGTEANADYS